MNLPEKKLGQILIKAKIITQGDLDLALETATKNQQTLAGFLIESKIVSKDKLGQLIADYFGVPYADLNSNPPSASQREKISKDLAQKFRAVLFREDSNGIIITTDDPNQTALKPVFKKTLEAKNITINYSLPDDIDNILSLYRDALNKRIAKIIEDGDHLAPKLIEEIVKDALAYQSSDIHFEPTGDKIIIRIRIDGLLQEVISLKREYYENILNWFKVTAHLRIDEHFAAQDGSLRLLIDKNKIDLRLSVVPTLEGEKIAIRILSKYVQDLTFADLGIEKYNNAQILKAISKPFGMILVCGPTGSGKTTTLYAILKSLSRPDINITTIEDPVEYRIKGFNQIQVSEQNGLTFAKGLKTIVRQDPDIILVGEIRDRETIEIAVNAALSGHLLFSTFHANDAATAIPRLLDMGVEPFLLASTLETLISQRLVRRICENCRTSYNLKAAEIKSILPQYQKYFGNKKEISLYKGSGCANCNHSGYKGRLGVYEVITFTNEMKDLILKRPTKNEIIALAKKQGAISMFEDGVSKVKLGMTTLDELLRVVPIE